MADSTPDAGVSVGIDVSVQKADPDAPLPGSPDWFAATLYDVIKDVTLPDGRVISAGSSTTPADLGMAHDIPAVHALVVDGSIWPTGVEH